MIAYRFVLIAGLAAVLAACNRTGQSSVSGPPTDGKPPVATVNGTPLSNQYFEFYVKTVTGKTPAELQPEQRDQVLDNLIRAYVVADQARKDGVDKEPDTAALLELSRVNVLQQAASAHYLKDKQPTEQELRAEYETQVAALPQQEYHARHILVATEQFAQKLVKELERGTNFADLARRESMDTSKENGGDLGWFTPDRMVKPFADAVVALKPGEFTRTPVQTQFGWHVIKLEETRDVAPPPFDQVRQRLEQLVQAKKFKAYTDELMKNARIEKNEST
ncbi:MAG TPA: peptidylprolyl isomerase [Steroidobacteraceae bacterium]